MLVFPLDFRIYRRDDDLAIAYELEGGLPMDFLDRQQERYRQWEEEDREWRRIQEEKADARRERLRIEEEQRRSEQKEREDAWRSESVVNAFNRDRGEFLRDALTMTVFVFGTQILTALIPIAVDYFSDKN